jgi:SAM-dependent methyltransferase
MADYDLLARHYDAVTGDSSTESAFIDSLIRQCNGPAGTLLEVACGTGGILAALAGRYQVSGLDISPGMLAVARAKLPEDTPLYLADMSGFRLDATFDAIICVYHGVNHLLGFAAWEGFFECAYQHLNDGGVLIFDIYTTAYLQRMTVAPEILQQFDGNQLRIKMRAADGGVFEWNIEVSAPRPGGRYELLTEVIRTTSFPLPEVMEALSTRFTDISVIESSSGDADEDGNRTWFVCTKPARRVHGEPGSIIPASGAGRAPGREVRMDGR